MSWLYWNPDRVAFYLPILNHPVVWYGVFFSMGCIIGYLTVIYLLTKDLERSSDFDGYHITNWKKLLSLLCTPKNSNHTMWPSIYHKLSKNQKKEIQVCNYKALTKETKTTIITQLKQAFTTKATEIKPFISTSKSLAVKIADNLTTMSILGILIGSRLGYVIFYALPQYVKNPLDIFKIWEGGLASHGGVIGILTALLILYHRYKKSYPQILSYIWLLDYLAIPSAFLGFCIRIGNFFNQEILGKPTQLFWAIVFETPFDGGEILPRHPVQLYEAFAYLAIFAILLVLWKKRHLKQGSGLTTGILFSWIFFFRFVLEFFKEPQSRIYEETTLLTGQYLSIPFLLLGLFLIIRHFYLKKKLNLV